MRITRIAGAAACLVLSIAVVGCGKSTPTSNGQLTSPVDVGVAVPAAWINQHVIKVGVACDYPPFGYVDIKGKNTGYDPEVARTLAAYAFGDDSKVEFTCVTPQNRIPYLETGKIDLIVSTLGYTKEREKTIDYSVPYFTSGAKLLVPKTSDITGWDGLKGKPVITKTGTTSSTFLTNCYSDSQQLLLDGTSDAVKALKAGRGAAFAEDSTLLLGLTLKDDSLEVVGVDKAETPWGLGIRKGEVDTKKWVDAVLADMQQKDRLWEIFTKVVPSKEAAEAFAGNMPRPGHDIVYTDKDTLTDCS